MSRKNANQPEYGTELKLAAVRRAFAGESVSAVAQELGIRRKRPYVWKDRYAELGEAGLARRRGGRPRKVVSEDGKGPDAMGTKMGTEGTGPICLVPLWEMLNVETLLPSVPVFPLDVKVVEPFCHTFWQSSGMIALEQRPGAAGSAKIIRRAGTLERGEHEKQAQGNRGTLSQVWLADYLQGK